MDETGMNGDFSGLMVGMIGMFVLTMIIIVFVLVYQRKLLKQKRQQEASEMQYQLGLLEANVKSQELERQRIARDLHDGVGVMLSTTQLYFDQLSDDTAGLHEEAKQKINELLEETVQSVRQISADLRPVILDNLGLSEAIAALIEKVCKAARLKNDFHRDSGLRLEKDEELILYRILQELLTNTIRHAEASHVSVRLEARAASVQLQYRDDGRGFGHIGNISTGLGMKNIESRVKILGGEISVRNASEPGVFISITIPKRD